MKTACELYGCVKVYGPYTGKYGRKSCILYFEDGTRLHKSNARMRMELLLGRVLPDDVHVDHVDARCTEDSLFNLQVLPVEQHREKTGEEVSAKRLPRAKLVCPACGKEFLTHPYRGRDGKEHCCSRSCSSKFFGCNQYGKFRPGTP